MVAAAVQQRVTTAAHLDAAMRTVGRIRHKAYLRLAIADVAAGAESLDEIDLAHLVLRESVIGAKGWRRGRSGRVSSRRYARWGRAA